jgi:hypothetical protein
MNRHLAAHPQLVNAVRTELAVAVGQRLLEARVEVGLRRQTKRTQGGRSERSHEVLAPARTGRRQSF